MAYTYSIYMLLDSCGGYYMLLNNLPKDPIMLLSFVNTELRDHYSDLPDFCSAHNVDINDLIGRLRAINYSYDPKTNQFI